MVKTTVIKKEIKNNDFENAISKAQKQWSKELAESIKMSTLYTNKKIAEIKTEYRRISAEQTETLIGAMDTTVGEIKRMYAAGFESQVIDLAKSFGDDNLRINDKVRILENKVFFLENKK